MTILFILLLIFLVLPLWLWLVLCIWPVSTPLARSSFFLVVPAYFWGVRHWDNPELAIKPVIAANFFAALLIILIGYKTFGADNAQQKALAQSPARSDAAWAQWCKEQNDASYDPELGTCVETGKTEAVARSRDARTFERLAYHLDQRGVRGEFDESQAAGAIEPQLLTPEIAKATPFYFLPLSMSQPPISVLLCVSEAACAKFAAKAAERAIGHVELNGNLLLVTPTEEIENERIEAMKAAFQRFKPG